jgi:uncharacterized protein (TIGR02246 family)
MSTIEVLMKTNVQPIHAIIGVLSLVMLSCGGPPPTDVPYDRAQAEAEIRAIENSWAQVAVSGDPAVIAGIFADEFVGVAPDGVRYTKQGFIDDTKAHPLGFTSIEIEEMKVRFEGNVAVAQGHETFTRKDGERGRFVWTDVLVRRGEKWQLIAAQDAMVPDAEQPRSVGLFEGSAPIEHAREGIDKTRSEYVAAWKAANASKIAELYTENALVLYPNQPAVTGRSAIVKYFERFFAEFPQNEFELTSEEIEIAGQWAFDRGAYRWKGIPRAGGEPAEDRGKYLVVLQRQASGEWKVARDMDNSDRSASQAARGTQ